MKIAIYHPSLSTYGGGETVALTIASFLSKNNEVDIFTPCNIDKKSLEEFFDLDLKNISIKSLRFSKSIRNFPTLSTYKSSLEVRLINKLNDYDVVIDTCTNGMFSKKIKPKTICYIHFPSFPKKKKGLKALTNFLLIKPKKAFQYDTIICNSEFTKNCVKKITDKEIIVINPPVKSKQIRSKKKQNIILTIGRFTYEKKHEVMIDAFKKLYKKNKDYEFHLIGSFQKNVSLYKQEYYEQIKDMSKGYPIFFHENMPHNKVLDFLAKSKIYWHARGYGETKLNEYENFGITTAEAMAAECIPIVINLGAQPEIVDHGKNGFCWNEPEELIKYTLKVMNNLELMKKLSKEARKKALKYDISIFREKILNSVKDLL